MNELLIKEKNQQEINTFDLLNQQIKKRQSSITEFKKSMRDDLVQVEEFELSLIEKYLPPFVDDQQLKETIQSIITENGLTKRDFKLVFSELEKSGIYSQKQQVVKTVNELIPK